jgi:hypothetical protein
MVGKNTSRSQKMPVAPLQRLLDFCCGARTSASNSWQVMATDLEHRINTKYIIYNLCKSNRRQNCVQTDVHNAGLLFLKGLPARAIAIK